MATKQMKRYNVLLTKQTACRNYYEEYKRLFGVEVKLEESIAYGKIMNELDALTCYLVKKLRLQEKI